MGDEFLLEVLPEVECDEVEDGKGSGISMKVLL